MESFIALIEKQYSWDANFDSELITLLDELQKLLDAALKKKKPTLPYWIS